MRVVMSQHMRLLETMSEHESFVGKNRVSLSVGDDGAAVENDDAGA